MANLYGHEKLANRRKPKYEKSAGEEMAAKANGVMKMAAKEEAA